MKSSETNDTIVAVSSAAASGARAVVRFSGELARSIAEDIFICAEGLPNSRVAVEGEIKIAGNFCIPTTLYFMPAPATYTREDIVEFHLPGCEPYLQAIIDEALKRGARLAAPGEFTRRAYLNGRIDINQAEAVLDVITAAHSSDARQALMQIGGFAAEFIASLGTQLLQTAALLELSIDFSDQDIEIAPSKDIQKRLRKLLDTIEEILCRSMSHVPRLGQAVVLFGPANAGKSTLFNALVGKEHAIVSHVPGTTRDYLEAAMDMEGIRFRLIDTAGFKDAKDLIETQAISRSHTYSQSASVRMLVVDCNDCPVSLAKIASEISASPDIVVLNKIDTLADQGDCLARIFDEVRQHFGDCSVVAASAEKRIGLAALQECLVRIVMRSGETQSEFVPNLRQRHALQAAVEGIRDALQAICDDAGEEIAALELRRAADALQIVTGRIGSLEVLDEIFGRFCIGK